MTLEAGLLNKSSCLAAALSVTKFTTITIMDLVILCCAAKSDLEVQQPNLNCLSQTYMYNKHTLEVGSLNKSSCLAAALGVNKFPTIPIMNLVILCCAT